MGIFRVSDAFRRELETNQAFRRQFEAAVYKRRRCGRGEYEEVQQRLAVAMLSCNAVADPRWLTPTPEGRQLFGGYTRTSRRTAKLDYDAEERKGGFAPSERPVDWEKVDEEVWAAEPDVREEDGEDLARAREAVGPEKVLILADPPRRTRRNRAATQEEKRAQNAQRAAKYRVKKKLAEVLRRTA